MKNYIQILLKKGFFKKKGFYKLKKVISYAFWASIGNLSNQQNDILMDSHKKLLVIIKDSKDL